MPRVDPSTTDAYIPVCDFCIEPLPGGKAFSALRAEWQVGLCLPDGTELDDNLDWKICIVCDGLIRAKKWKELLDRSISCRIRSGAIANDPLQILSARSSALGTWRAVLGEEFRRGLVMCQLEIKRK